MRKWLIVPTILRIAFIDDPYKYLHFAGSVIHVVSCSLMSEQLSQATHVDT